MTLPTWLQDPIGAVGDLATAGAFVLAAVIYARDRSDKRSAQAEQVSAWLVFAPMVPDRDRFWRWQVEVYNVSDQPVYEVEATTPKGVIERAPWEVLPPGAVERVQLKTTEAGAPRPTYAGGVTLHFTDASGQRWRRTPDGRLHRVRRRRDRPAAPVPAQP